MGWVPVDPSLRTHLWHLSVVNLSTGHGLIVKYNQDMKSLSITINPLKDLVGNTFELIGTNVNGNPYGMSFFCGNYVLLFEFLFPTWSSQA